MPNRIEELEQEIEDLMTQHEVVLELKNLKIEELESEIKYLLNGFNLLHNENNIKDDLEDKNQLLNDENDRLKLSLMFSKH